MYDTVLYLFVKMAAAEIIRALNPHSKFKVAE